MRNSPGKALFAVFAVFGPFLLAAAFVLAMSAHPANAQEYVLGAGDLLKITVYENDDLTTNTRVNGDGMVNVPLVGNMKVGGMSVSDAEKKISKALGHGYIVDPHVSIFVVEYKSKKVTILGEVMKPGLYELDGNSTLLEIISKAGGLTEKAGNTVSIKRKKGGSKGKDTTIKVNLKALFEKGDMSKNIYVQDGDNIFVTQSGLVYVTGEVKKPGAFKFEQGMTVMKAIALAEGLTDKAAPGRTKLIRKKGGKEQKTKVDMSEPVMPDDVISVPESFF